MCLISNAAIGSFEKSVRLGKQTAKDTNGQQLISHLFSSIQYYQ